MFELYLSLLRWQCHELRNISHTVLNVNPILGDIQKCTQRQSKSVLVSTSLSSGPPSKSTCVLSGVALPARLVRLYNSKSPGT